MLKQKDLKRATLIEACIKGECTVLLPFSKSCDILLSIGNEHCSKSVLPLHLMAFAIRK